MEIGWESIVIFAASLFLLFFVGKLFLVPLKIIWRLIVNGIIGGVMLLLFNWAASFFDISIGINPITALVAGFLGVPGVAMLLVLQAIL